MSIAFPTVPEAFAGFERARDAYMTWVQAEKPIPHQVSEALFSQAAIVMLAYQDPRNWPDGPAGKPLHHFPITLSYICFSYIRYMLAGKLPAPIAHLLRRGTPAIGPEEMWDIGRAVAYIDAVRTGIVQDHRPTQTVADAFAVEKRTVQRWVKEQAAKGVTYRDFVAKDLPPRKVGASIRAGMQEAANRYRRRARAASKRPRKAKSI